MPGIIGAGITKVLAIAIVLGLCLMFHEAGHFLVAKLFRMRVFDFAFGLGPALFSRTCGETKYSVRLIPFGAFVRIAGMEPGEADVENGFHSRPRWQGASVIFAGPLMNVILAVLLFTCVVYREGLPFAGERGLLVTGLIADGGAMVAGVQVGDRITALDGNRQSLEVTEVRPDSPAARAGLKAQMRILQVGDDAVATPADICARLRKGDDPLALRCADANAKSLSDIAQIIALPTKELPPAPAEGGAKAAAYCRDVLGIACDGLDNQAVIAYVSDRPDKSVALTVMRDGREVTLSVTPKATWERMAEVTEAKTLTVPHRQVGRIGVVLGFSRRPVGVREAIAIGAVTSVSTVAQAVDTFRAMIRGRVSAESASGPVAIMAMSAETVQKGWGELFQFCGMISVSLAVVNLFPIPPFDGFHIVLLGYESIIRRRIDAKHQSALMIGGFVFVVALFIVLTYKDIWNLIRYGSA